MNSTSRVGIVRALTFVSVMVGVSHALFLHHQLPAVGLSRVSRYTRELGKGHRHLLQHHVSDEEEDRSASVENSRSSSDEETSSDEESSILEDALEMGMLPAFLPPPPHHPSSKHFSASQLQLLHYAVLRDVLGSDLKVKVAKESGRKRSMRKRGKRMRIILNCF